MTYPSTLTSQAVYVPTDTDGNELDEFDPQEILNNYLDLQDSYQARNVGLGMYEKYFEGEHWSQDKTAEDDTSFQLTYNYVKAVVMKYAALLSKTPRVRIAVQGEITDRIRAAKREKLIRGLWPQLMKAWRDVEFNAAKKSYGVIQVLWKPEPGQPATSQTSGKTVHKYTKSPFLFRSIAPNNFFPVYRTFNDPDDFLYVILSDPGRLVEDVERLYGKEVVPTDLKEGSDGTCDLIEKWDEEYYTLIARTTYVDSVSRSGEITYGQNVVLLDRFPHEYKRIPFFVLQNIRNPDEDPTYKGSLGDIDSIIEINRHFNLVMSEAAEEIMIHIHNPVAYKSDDHTQDPSKIQMKPAAVIPIGLDEELDPIIWAGLAQSVETHLDRNQAAIQDLSFVGQAGFGQYPAGATGVGLQIVMSSLEQVMALKVPLRQTCLESIIEHLFKTVETKLTDKDKAFRFWLKDKLGRFNVIDLSETDIAGEYYCDVDYGNLLPRNQTEFEQNETYKFTTGVQSQWTTQDAVGIEDPDDEQDRLRQEWSDPVLNPDRVKATADALMAQMQAKQAMQQMQQMEQQQQQMAQQGQPPVQPGVDPNAQQQPTPDMGMTNTAPPVPPTDTGAANPQGAPYAARQPAPNMGQLEQLLNQQGSGVGQPPQ